MIGIQKKRSNAQDSLIQTSLTRSLDLLTRRKRLYHKKEVAFQARNRAKTSLNLRGILINCFWILQ